MNGIVFYKTKKFSQIRDFYENTIGLKIWLEQKECIIYRYGNFLLGFCNRDQVDTDSMITFFFESRTLVDEFYQKLKHLATAVPKYNPNYDIYQFFAKDPEGRTLEFQYFENEIKPFASAADTLVKRRSVRSFSQKIVSDELLTSVFELCRYSPTSMNTQSYYYIVVRDSDKIEHLSSVRDGASSPLAASNLNVAICVDPAKTKRKEEDGIIASYHFILACECHELGTCWIADMNRDTVKEILNIPKEHYIATITPVGYAKNKTLQVPKRRDISEFVIW